MPLTDFQKSILRLLATNRSEESYVAGAIALNSSDSSIRYSNDIDFFQVSDTVTLESAESDCKKLTEFNYSVEWALKQPGFCRAVVSKNNESLKLEWSRDSAFRFFPIIPDKDLGFRLHMADAATNKILACGGRRAARDFIDMINLHYNFLHVGALIWAACGKDPGFSPELLLELIDRNKSISPQEFADVQVVQPVNPEKLRSSWFEIRDQSLKLFEQLETEDIGVLFIDPRTNNPVVPTSDKKFIRHTGSVGGCWPQIVLT